MSARPNSRRNQPGPETAAGQSSGLDSVIQKTTNYNPRADRMEQQQRERERYYSGVTADSPPVNQSLGAVVSLEKTDLMFTAMVMQVALLFLIYLELRGGR